MTLDDLRYFSSAEGRLLLKAAAETPGDDLTRLTRLRRHFPADHCRVAVLLTLLRGRAAEKFPRAPDMVFDREGLEQASGHRIAAYRARRYLNAGRIADLCCGIGGDTTALAACAEVVPIDINADRLGMARWNAAVHGHTVFPVCADVSTWRPEADAAFFDPSRRAPGRRLYRLRDYLPPVHAHLLQTLSPHLGIKVAPGIPHDELPSHCEAEFISDAGTCKEAVLWFGNLRTHANRRATLLPCPHSLTDRPAPNAPVRPPGAFLYEPDRAVIRSHLIDVLADELGAWKLDELVAYLSSDHPVDTPFARRFLIHDQFPYQLKRLRAYLSQRGIGRLNIKRRRFPMTPDDLRSRLKLEGTREATIVLTRIADKLSVLYCVPQGG